MPSNPTSGAVLAVTLVTLLAGCGGSGTDDTMTSPTATSSPSPSESATPEPTVDPVVASVPTGKYRTRARVTANSFDDAEVGDVSRSVWTFAPDCTAAADCGGSVTSSSGAEYAFTWDGSTLSLTRDRVVSKVDCGSTGSYTVTYTFDPADLVATGAEGAAPQSLEGDMVYRAKVSKVRNCDVTGDPAPQQSVRLVATRR